MKTTYNTFKSSLIQLERLQEFKVPFIKLFENFIYSYGASATTDESMCEFYLIDGEEIAEDYLETVEDVDKELCIIASKFAKLLEAKEQRLKENCNNFSKQTK